MELTQVVDVENPRHGTARPAMPNLGLVWRSVSMRDGGIDLGEGDINLG